MDKGVEKKARLAEMYGAGDVNIAKVTGQYPNPSLLPTVEEARQMVRTLFPNNGKH